MACKDGVVERRSTAFPPRHETREFAWRVGTGDMNKAIDKRSPLELLKDGIDKFITNLKEVAECKQEEEKGKGGSGNWWNRRVGLLKRKLGLDTARAGAEISDRSAGKMYEKSKSLESPTVKENMCKRQDYGDGVEVPGFSYSEGDDGGDGIDGVREAVVSMFEKPQSEEYGGGMEGKGGKDEEDEASGKTAEVESEGEGEEEYEGEYEDEDEDEDEEYTADDTNEDEGDDEEVGDWVYEEEEDTEDTSEGKTPTPQNTTAVLHRLQYQGAAPGKELDPAPPSRSENQALLENVSRSSPQSMPAVEQAHVPSVLGVTGNAEFDASPSHLEEVGPEKYDSGELNQRQGLGAELEASLGQGASSRVAMSRDCQSKSCYPISLSPPGIGSHRGKQPSNPQPSTSQAGAVAHKGAAQKDAAQDAHSVATAPLNSSTSAGPDFAFSDGTDGGDGVDDDVVALFGDEPENYDSEWGVDEKAQQNQPNQPIENDLEPDSGTQLAAETMVDAITPAQADAKKQSVMEQPAATAPVVQGADNTQQARHSAAVTQNMEVHQAHRVHESNTRPWTEGLAHATDVHGSLSTAASSTVTVDVNFAAIVLPYFFGPGPVVPSSADRRLPSLRDPHYKPSLTVPLVPEASTAPVVNSVQDGNIPSITSPAILQEDEISVNTWKETDTSVPWPPSLRAATGV